MPLPGHRERSGDGHGREKKRRYAVVDGVARTVNLLEPRAKVVEYGDVRSDEHGLRQSGRTSECGSYRIQDGDGRWECRESGERMPEIFSPFDEKRFVDAVGRNSGKRREGSVRDVRKRVRNSSGSEKILRKCRKCENGESHVAIKSESLGKPYVQREGGHFGTVKNILCPILV